MKKDRRMLFTVKEGDMASEGGKKKLGSKHFKYVYRAPVDAAITMLSDILTIFLLFALQVLTCGMCGWSEFEKVPFFFSF